LIDQEDLSGGTSAVLLRVANPAEAGAHRWFDEWLRSSNPFSEYPVTTGISLD